MPCTPLGAVQRTVARRAGGKPGIVIRAVAGPDRTWSVTGGASGANVAKHRQLLRPRMTAGEIRWGAAGPASGPQRWSPARHCPDGGRRAGRGGGAPPLAARAAPFSRRAARAGGSGPPAWRHWRPRGGDFSQSLTRLSRPPDERSTRV
jgi:hypothetical protein